MLPAISCGVRQMLPSNTIANSSCGNGNGNGNGMLGTKGDCFWCDASQNDDDVDNDSDDSWSWLVQCGAAWSSWCCRNSKLNGLNYFSWNRASVQFVAHSLSQFHYYKYYYYYYYCHSKFTVCTDSDSKRVKERGRGKQLPSFGDCDCCAFICNWNCVTFFFDFAIRVVCLRFCIGIGHCHSQETDDSELAHARAAE